MRIAENSRSAMARAARAWEAWVGSVFERREVWRGMAWEGGGADGEESQGGKSSRTISNFICGVELVPTATSVGSVGQTSKADGVNDTQAFE